MTASPPGMSALPATPLLEPAGEKADDIMLIERLRARAWDPGLRVDTADVPSA